jgi:hypothetical protein
MFEGFAYAAAFIGYLDDRTMDYGLWIMDDG